MTTLSDVYEESVYAFGVRDGIAGFWPEVVISFDCPACGARVLKAPERFGVEEVEGGGWALVCQCGASYYPASPDHRMGAETLAFLGKIGAQVSGTARVGNFAYSLLAATLPEFERIHVPDEWLPLNWHMSWASEEEGVIAWKQGGLLIVWLAPGKEAYEALRGLLLR